MTVRTAEDFTIFCGDWFRRLQQDSFLNCTVYCYLFRKLLNQIPTFPIPKRKNKMGAINQGKTFLQESVKDRIGKKQFRGKSYSAPLPLPFHKKEITKKKGSKKKINFCF